MCVYVHVQSRPHRVVCVCVCFLCGCEDGRCVEWNGCISIQQRLPTRSVWVVGWREGGGGGGGGWGSPSSEQNSVMGWNKAARRGAAGLARPGQGPLDLPKRKALHTSSDKRISFCVCVPKSSKAQTGTIICHLISNNS